MPLERTDLYNKGTILPGSIVSCVVRYFYNQVTCITNDFGGPKHFVIKAFNCIASYLQHSMQHLLIVSPNYASTTLQLHIAK